MIRFKSPIENISEYQSGPLPKNAIRIETPSTIEELMKKATPIAVILCVSLFAAMLVKNLYCREMVIQPNKNRVRRIALETRTEHRGYLQCAHGSQVEVGSDDPKYFSNPLVG